jgi:hypothetical protein
MDYLMRPHFIALASVAVIAFASIAAFADPPADPSTQPAPYVLIMPAGMQQVTIGDHTVICPPNYEAAVRQALGKFTPTTRPTTTASSIVERLASSRAALVDEMSTDLGVPKDKVAAFIDEKLKPSLQYLAIFHPRVFVVVATQDQLRAAIKGGWHAPLFHYNPLADHTFFEPRVSVPDSAETKVDDLVILSEVLPNQSDGDIADTLIKTIHDFESGLGQGTTQGALLQIRNKFSDFILDTVIKPLNLPSTEAWFGRGVNGTMSSKYMAMLTGFPRSVLTTAAASDTSSNPFKSAPLDLMHEFDQDSLKPGYAVYYLDAVGRKGTGVLQHLLEKNGDAVVPKLLAAIKATPPADNDALVALIQNVTGVDLTNDLLPPPLP